MTQRWATAGQVPRLAGPDHTPTPPDATSRLPRDLLLSGYGGAPQGPARGAGQGPGGQGRRPSFSAVVGYGQDRVEVDLTGSRPLANAPAVHVPVSWRPSPQDPPTIAMAPCCLGVGPHGYLFTDLALALGVVTVTGDPQARTEFGAELANRLGTAVRRGNRRLAVVVAGSPFHPDLLVVDPPRIDSIRSFDPAATPERVVVTFLFCALDSIEDAEQVAAIARGSRRVVPIVIGDVVPAQWSLTVHRAG